MYFSWFEIAGLALTALAGAYALRMVYVFTSYTKGVLFMVDLAESAESWTELVAECTEYRKSSNKVSASAALMVLCAMHNHQPALVREIRGRIREENQAREDGTLYQLSEADIQRMRGNVTPESN